MKCNNCGNENADTAAFCSNCGSALQPAAPVATPIENPTVDPIASTPVSAPVTNPEPIVAPSPVASTPVVNPAPAVTPTPVATSAPTKTKSKAPLIIILVVALVAICGGIATAVILLTGKTETYACTKEGKTLTSSIAATFKRNKINKLEYTLILEESSSSNGSNNNNSGSYGDYSFSYSGPATITSVSAPDNDDWDYYGYDDSSSNYNYGSSSNASSEEMMEILALSLVFANFEQYADDPGVDYYESEGSTISTYAVTIDIDKLASKTKNAVFDDEELKVTPEEFQKTYTSQGYTCKKK